MKRFIIQLVFFTAALFCALLLLDGLYTKYIVPKTCSKLGWMFNLQNGNYDFAVLGNSRVLDVVNVTAIEKYSKLHGINLGLSGAKPIENYLILKRFLETNKVKTILFQVDAVVTLPVISPANDKLPFFEMYGYMPYIYDSDVYQIITQYASPIKYLPWRYIPFMRYAEFNHMYTPDNLRGNGTCDFDNTGYASIRRGLKHPPVPDSTKTGAKALKNISASNIAVNFKAIKQIIRLCQEKNIKIVLFTSPINKMEFQYPVTDYCSRLFTQFSKESGLQYWDLSRQFISSPDSIFSDSFHSNYLADDSLGKILAMHLKAL